MGKLMFCFGVTCSNSLNYEPFLIASLRNSSSSKVFSNRSIGGNQGTNMNIKTQVCGQPEGKRLSLVRLRLLTNLDRL